MYYRRQMILYSSEFLTSLSFTILASFYPGLASDKGIPVWLIGVIFSIDPMVGLPTSIIAGKSMHRIGRKTVLSFGMFLSACSILLIGMLQFCELGSAIALSVTSRILAGIGAGCAMTSSAAILIIEYPKEIDKVMGYYEAASGLGLLIGPIVGSLLNLFPIVISFTATAFIYFLYSSLSYILLGTLSQTRIDTNKHSYLSVATKPKILIDFCAQMWLLLALGYLSTIIELHLRTFGIHSMLVGVFYSICTLSYFVTSILESYLIRCFNSKILIVAGILLTAVAFVLIGPWNEILPQDIICVGIGLGLLGFSGALMYSKNYLVPTTSNIVNTATNVYSLKQDEAMLDTIAACTNFFSNLGEIIGPIAAGLISEVYGFNFAFFVVALGTFGFAVVYLAVATGSSRAVRVVDAEATDGEKHLIHTG